jgi:hypothetical protein
MSISWDYEDSGKGYYHIYAVGGPLDGRMNSMCIDVPSSPKRHGEVMAIVAALQNIEASLEE